MSRETQRLELVDKFYPTFDALIHPTAAIEHEGRSDCDLLCGNDGQLLLRNYSIQEAQHHFGREHARVLTKCPLCGSYNLLAAALEKLQDGSFVTLPRRE
jgi:hypothetical protein